MKNKKMNIKDLKASATVLATSVKKQLKGGGNTAEPPPFGVEVYT